MIPVAKKFVGRRVGMNTEAPLTEWPEGFVVDTNNFELLPDGSFKKRYGLANEVVAINIANQTDDVDTANRTFIWENVANDSLYKYVVVQQGYMLYFYKWNPLIGQLITPQAALDDGVDLSLFADSVGDINTHRRKVSIEPCSFASGLGKLYITHKWMDPLEVTYVPETDTLEYRPYTVYERNYLGVDDGIPVDFQPPDATIPESHRYNLLNRGWRQSAMDQYYTDKSKWPAKNMLLSLAYRRYDDVSTPAKTYSPDEGIYEFSSEKLASELFGQASAPQGHLITKVWDSTVAWSGIGGSDYTTLPVTGVTAVRNADETFTITCTTGAAHGLIATNTTYISGMKLKFGFRILRLVKYVTKSIDEIVTVVSAPTTTSFTFVYAPNLEVSSSSFFDEATENGYYTSNAPEITNDTYGVKLDSRFRLNSFFLGRLWYSGLDETGPKNRVYFSKVVDDVKKVGDCLTEADPTDTRISDPVATDGGYITINEMGYVHKLVPYGNSMLVFATKGIWQIGPGSLGFFSPLSYSVRRLSSAGTVSAGSIVEVEGSIVYWGKDGIYALVEDENSGYLTARNLSSETINRLYSQILPAGREECLGAYDDHDKRVFWLYGSLDTNSTELDGSLYFNKIGPTIPDDQPISGTEFRRNHILVLDLRTGGFSRWQLPDMGVNSSYQGMLIWPLHMCSERKHKVKILYFIQGASARTAYWMEFADDSYMDVDASPVDAYIVSGPETLGDTGRKKSAPYVHCFFRRVDNSGCYLQTVWDWSKTTVTGNVSNPMQCYREVAPRSDGSKLIVTRNKVRGKGHSLYVGLHAEPLKPCWLEGWQVLYSVDRSL